MQSKQQIPEGPEVPILAMIIPIVILFAVLLLVSDTVKQSDLPGIAALGLSIFIGLLSHRFARNFALKFRATEKTNKDVTMMIIFGIGSMGGAFFSGAMILNVMGAPTLLAIVGAGVLMALLLGYTIRLIVKYGDPTSIMPRFPFS